MIGIIIPVYATEKRVAKTAVLSIAAQAEGLPHYASVIIVRNGGQRSPCASDKAAAVVDLPQNIGYTAAVNVGLRTAETIGCDYFVVSSADVFPRRRDWLQDMMGVGVVSALEEGATNHDAHPGMCPFWGGMFGFSAHVLADVGYLPAEYTRIGDAAFAARAALLGWSVKRGPAVVEHRHPHAANNAADPDGAVYERERDALRQQYGHSICGLLNHLDTLDPVQRILVARSTR